MLLFAATLLLCQLDIALPLQPYEVSSASGEWTLEVKSSDPHGKGAMRARILRSGEVSWAGEFPWTFEQAGISDDGTCVGYSNVDKLRIAVLDAGGASRKQHDIEHTGRIHHGPAIPDARGPVFVHPTADVALISVRSSEDSGPTPWRAFQLSTGEALPDVVPALPLVIGESKGLYERDTRAIGDTELMLVYWWYADYDAADLDWSQDGAVFALHDLAGAVVWRLPLLDDYTDRTSEEADDKLEREVERRGVILSVGPGRRFALHHVREGARVEYAVDKDAGGAWSVKEVARQPWTAPEPVPSAAEPIELVQRSSVALTTASSSAKHPVHGVNALGFTEAGEIELLRDEGGNALSYARMRTDGELLLEQDLSTVENAQSMRQYHDLSGDRWLVQCLGADPPWFTVDVRTGGARPAPLPDGMLGCHVAPLADGGYLALVKQIVRSLAFTELFYVQADDTIGWRRTVTGIGPDERDFDRAVYFGNGIARTGDRTFTILGSSELTRADLDGNVLEQWKLKEVLGRDAGYMNGLLSDARGGVIFASKGEFQRVDAFGTRTGSFVPRRADGSSDASMGRLLHAAPDGRLWTSDRQRVYRLDEQGVVDLTIGPEARDDELVEAATAAIDVLGRALVQDRVSNSVHVFDADGRRLGVCRFAPAERSAAFSLRQLGGDHDGTVWVRRGKGRARFDASGARLEDGTQDVENAEEDVRKALEAMRTRPDGTWLATVAQRAFLPGGRRLVVERSAEEGRSATLHFYGSAGEGLHSVALPGDSSYYQISVGARWLVLGDYGPSWTLVRLADEKVFQFDAHLANPGSWHLGQTPDGKTLLLLCSRALQLVQFELP